MRPVMTTLATKITAVATAGTTTLRCPDPSNASEATVPDQIRESSTPMRKTVFTLSKGHSPRRPPAMSPFWTRQHSPTVDVVEEELDGDCVTCSGKVLYEATIEGADPAAVDRVEVTHATGETDTVEADDFSTRRPELIDAEIKESVSDARSSETDDESQIDLAELSSVSESETGAIELHGTIPTNTPHYEAVLDDASVQGTALEVAIDVESTLDDEDDESDAGTQVLGVVFYIAMFEIRNIDALDSVRIDHPQSGHGITWESDSETAERGHSHETSNTSTNESE
jgi:hypothetical protein